MTGPRLTSPAIGAVTGTSAGGSLRGASPAIVLLGLIQVVGTTGAAVEPTEHELEVRRAEASTNSGVAVPRVMSSSAGLAEVRRLSGLTWDQLSRLFGVSRRALHFWASGRPLHARHEERLQRTLGALRAIDRGAASLNRGILLTVLPGGESPFDMLADGRFEEVRALGAQGVQTRVRPDALPQEARDARRPLAPDVLADAQHEAPVAPVGRVLGSSQIRRPRRV